MPTGYTAGILDGEVTNFKQFAKQCMRNFGAMMHMRDDNFNTEYKPRVPSDYHIKALQEANKLLEDSQKLSDEEVVNMRKNELLKSKDYHIKAIEKIRVDTDNLNKFLQEAEKYVPPTDQHKGIKKFMIDQITGTISFDCNSAYHADKLIEINKELEFINPKEVRMTMLEKATKDLRYHQTEYDNDVKRCNESNQWVQAFIDSL